MTATATISEPVDVLVKFIVQDNSSVDAGEYRQDYQLVFEPRYSQATATKGHSVRGSFGLRSPSRSRGDVRQRLRLLLDRTTVVCKGTRIDDSWERPLGYSSLAESVSSSLPTRTNRHSVPVPANCSIEME